MIILEVKITEALPVLAAKHAGGCRVWIYLTPDYNPNHATWRHCTCNAADTEQWMRVGNNKSFIDQRDAEVWGERYYPTDVRRIREV